MNPSSTPSRHPGHYRHSSEGWGLHEARELLSDDEAPAFAGATVVVCCATALMSGGTVLA